MDSEEEGGDHLESHLVTWALEENITHSSLNKLLKILKYHHPSQPVDARTLLGTARSESVVVQENAGGRSLLWNREVDDDHFGGKYVQLGQWCIPRTSSEC